MSSLTRWIQKRGKFVGVTNPKAKDLLARQQREIDRDYDKFIAAGNDPDRY